MVKIGESNWEELFVFVELNKLVNGFRFRLAISAGGFDHAGQVSPYLPRELFPLQPSYMSQAIEFLKRAYEILESRNV